MTTATVANPTGTQFALWVVISVVAFACTGLLLWLYGRDWQAHDDELADHAQQLGRLGYQMESLLTFLGLDIPEPAADDSPEAMTGDDDDTEEFPAVPATEPSGIPLQVHAALIEARDLSDEKPHPVDSAARKAKNAADIEEALKQFTFTGGRK